MNNNKSFVIALALILALIKLSNGYAITNENQKKIILDKHNEVRSLAANGKMSPYGFDTAAKMYPLTWDSELANTAERLASSCSFDHNTFGSGNGQNIAMGGGSNAQPGVGVPNEAPQGTGSCSNCYASDDEAIKFLQYSWISGSSEQSEGPNGVNHFTQMVDDDTFKVGCALNNNCGGGPYYLVCNYDPAGNFNRFNGNAVYETGSTGSKCPKGASNGLCQGTPQQSGSGGSGGSGGGSSGGSTDNSQAIDDYILNTCNNNYYMETSFNGVTTVTTVKCNNGAWKTFQ